MNNRGQTLSSWWTVILFGMVFIVLFMLLIAGFNEGFGKNEDATFGRASLSGANDTINTFETKVNELQANVQEGEFSFLDGIIVIGTVGEMVRTIIVTILGVLTGSWINDIVVGLLGFPSALAVVLRILFAGSLIFILIKLIFRFKG